MIERLAVRSPARGSGRAAVPLALIAMALVAAVAQAGQPPTPAQGRPLPSFTVVAPGGRVVDARGLTGESSWVLVYVRPGGHAARRLLASLAGWQLPAEMAKRLVLVVEGPADQATAYLAREAGPTRGGLAWYADPDGGAAGALGFVGTPALLGVRDGAIAWTLTGVLTEPSTYESVVRAWIGAAPSAR